MKNIQWCVGRPAKASKVDCKLIDEAVAAKKSDVAIIFGGLTHDFDPESASKKIWICLGQNVLIHDVAQANPNIVLAIIASSPINLWAIVNRIPCNFMGMFWWLQAGNAVAD